MVAPEREDSARSTHSSEPQRTVAKGGRPTFSLTNGANRNSVAFLKYLMDVSFRRHHQIILSTHSSIMMDALPPEARKLLVRTNNGVDVYDRVTSSRVKTALSAGESGHTVICVEDEFAQSLLREILRKKDNEILQSVVIIPFGDARAVLSAKDVLKKALL